MGPAVRLLLELYQIKAKDLSATGPKGALLKRYIPLPYSACLSYRVFFK